MQIRLNPNSSNLHFGTFHADSHAKNSLRVRVEKDADWFTIEDFVTFQKENKVAQIVLSGSPDSTILSGCVAAGGKIEQYTEKCTGKPGSPVPFIEFLCNRANHMRRIHKAVEANPMAILKKM